VTGRRAFSGQSSGDTMAAILQAEPPAIAESGKQVPPEMDRVIGRCLAKNPGERFHSARRPGVCAAEHLRRRGGAKTNRATSTRPASHSPCGHCGAGDPGRRGMVLLAKQGGPEHRLPCGFAVRQRGRQSGYGILERRNHGEPHGQPLRATQPESHVPQRGVSP